MKMFKEQLFLLFILYIHNSSCVVDDIYDIEKAIWQLHLMIDNITSDSTGTANRLLTGNISRNQEITNLMDEIDGHFIRLEEFMESKIIHDLFDSWPSSILLYKCIDTLEIFFLSIDEFYKEFRQQRNETGYDSDQVQEFLELNILNIEDRLTLIRKNMMRNNEYFPGYQNLVYAITGSAIILQPNLCGNSQILSHFLVQLFRMVMVAEMKANVMLAIERLRRFPRAADWMTAYNKERFIKQFQNYVNMFSANIQQTDAIYLKACDPPGNKWIRDESFYEAEGVFQTAIFHYDSMKCNHRRCFDAWFGKAHICDPQYYDARSGCSGNLTECADLYTVQACVLKSGPHKFQYANSSKYGLHGNNSECPKDDGYIINDLAARNFNYTTCACNCYGDDSKISFFLMESRVEWNMVITGVRFIRKNQILYIQPREGKLRADGHVFRYPQRWVTIPDHIPESQIHVINDENRVFFFDDVQLPPGFVLTGVSFSKVIRGSVAGFAIKIYGIPFDYETGKLYYDPRFLITKEALYDNSGMALPFVPISSVYGNSNHTPSPKFATYVILERSEFRDDFGQSTLPLFDAVPITASSPSLLSGIGIFHKGAEGYAGFISLRVYGIRYAKYFTDFQSIYMKNNKMIL